MKTIDKIDKYLNENKEEDKAEINKLLKTFYDKCKGKQKCVHKKVLDNIVNNKYVRRSNQFIEMTWDEFNKMFPS